MSVNEESLEKIIIEKIEDLGYEYVKGDAINRATIEDVLIEEDLRQFLRKKYASNSITEKEIDRIIDDIKSITVGENNIYDGNKIFFTKYIMYGFSFNRDSVVTLPFHLRLIDFDEIEQLKTDPTGKYNNIFKVCNQVEIKGSKATRIPDTIIYINGIPLVVSEHKSAVREEATVYDAYVQITTRYMRDIPELFKYNAFAILSDGVNTRMGSVFADYEYFYPWRKVENDDVPVDSFQSLDSLINGLLRKDRILDVLYNFIFFPDEDSKKIKIVCNYSQYFASRKLLENVLKHRKISGVTDTARDGKGGTFFGTTGCGKSFCMLFLGRLLMTCKELNSPTIIYITDRTDLDDQLSETMINATKFINDKDVKKITSRNNGKDSLMETLKGHKSGGVYLTTIQKFTEDAGLLSDRDNIICISDEAHRSQINLKPKNVIDKNSKTVTKKYGYATFLHESLPNATFIGFTGTPIKETIDVYGDIIEKYTMRDSVADGVTSKLVYDGRFIKAILDTKAMSEIEDYYKKCIEEGANEYAIEESKEKTSILNIIGNTEILEKVANNFIEHYEKRVAEGSTVAGKAMFILPTRPIAFKFWKIVKDLRPEWFIESKTDDDVKFTARLNELTIKKENEGLNKEEFDELEKIIKLNELKPTAKIKIVATRNKDDELELYNLLGDDEDRKEFAKQFKTVESNFKIAIVVDMWTTGFDVPCLDTIYIDKPMGALHNIIQTVSRGNRKFPGKEDALIVDYIGIKDMLDKALKLYADYGDDDVIDIEKAINFVKDKLENLDKLFAGFDNTKYFTGTDKEKFNCLNEAVEFITKKEPIMSSEKTKEQRFMFECKDMIRAFNLCSVGDDFTKVEVDKIYFYKSIRSIILKVTRGSAPDSSVIDKRVAEMLENAIKENGVEEVYSTTNGFESSEIDLFSDKYLEKIDGLKYPNIALRTLMQLLKHEIKNFGGTNKARSITFTERMNAILAKYNARTLDQKEIIALIKETVVLITEVKNAGSAYESLGLNADESPFYDVLILVEDKYKFEFPQEQNIALAKAITILVKDNTKYVDWENRDDIKAELECGIIELLTEFGFPPIEACEIGPGDYKDVYLNVIDQAKNYKKNND